MVLNLLQVSRRRSGIGETELVELNPLLHDVCETMEMRAQRYRKHIRLEMEPHLKVNGHTDRLRQLFINLLDNAIKYSDPYSEIGVSARREGLALQFTFSNAGDTVPSDKLANVFKPFYAGEQTATGEGSIGLGLSIVKSIVEEHGGSVRMDSVNRRTTVVVKIPEAEGRARP